jgi:hypothetical protein
VLVRDPDGRPRGLVGPVGLHVLGEHPLAQRERLGDAAQEPERLREAIAPVGALLLLQGGLEGGAGVLPACVLECPPAVCQMVARVHGAIMSVHVGRR